MAFRPLDYDEHPTVLAAEYQRIRASLSDNEAMLLACLTNVLNELPDWLDGDYAAGSALDHANTAIEAMLRGSGLLPIPPEARERAERLRDDS
ncbi:hypothetical protein J8I29_20220 [Labrys sp. LIt4]|uniref:hypothetical protein n=1 Tax=Labrys sp. LIt4 TaxID=2821355 RepID=UPI001AE0A9EC|nr:hypothetical protein [Labrys sp. LIt4]MBP0581665.1 hypothetical protein [Labrys sp. LIt4]